MRTLVLATGVAAVAAATASLLAHDPITTRVSWDREIAPLVGARCVSCHSPGGRAPMSLATYTDARPWARAIREEVLARRMPKWPVVRGYGDFANDPSLSPFEIALLVAWVDGGAPESLAKAGQPERPAPPAPRVPAFTPPAPARRTAIGCGTNTLPSGTLLGLIPRLEAGASIEIVVEHTDGLEEPILWLRGFDPAFATTYWLRRPIRLTTGARARVAGTPGEPSCLVTLLFAADVNARP